MTKLQMPLPIWLTAVGVACLIGFLAGGFTTLARMRQDYILEKRTPENTMRRIEENAQKVEGESSRKSIRDKSQKAVREVSEKAEIMPSEPPPPPIHEIRQKNK